MPPDDEDFEVELIYQSEGYVFSTLDLAMGKTVWLRAVLTVLAFCSSTTGLENRASEKEKGGRDATGSVSSPAHVLMIVVDDLGFSDLGYKRALYNLSDAGASFSTPALDALALAGVRLESYYVHSLCSPSRTAFLSGRYAYTTGMNAEVITNGHPDQLSTNIRTVADLLKLNGWATFAAGKWDCGMTTWGTTPTCRGFDHFSGFYNADEEYFNHMVGAGLDLRRDFAPDRNETGVFSSDLFGNRAAEWIGEAVAGGATNSFAYVAFQAIHGPQQAPQAYLDGHCSDAFPASQPIRRIACAQMASVDANVAKIRAAYERAGVWDQTTVFFTTDNGGNPDTGGGNAPLRGMKASMFEGGLRGAAFVSGAGIAATAAGSVSHELYSLVDWLPTIAHGIAGVDLAEALVPKHPFQAPPPPLDGIDVWTSISTGAPSPRTEALLYLMPFGCFTGHSDVPCLVPGQAAIRVGRYKLIHGHVAQYMGATNVSAQFCGPRDGVAQGGTFPLNVTAATTPPFCPTGWVNIDESVTPPPEEAGPGGACATGPPCLLPATSPMLTGTTMLFDVVGDMTEQHDLAAENPALVAQLLARIQAINGTNVPQANSPVDPASAPSNFGGVWTPWRGNPDPAVCDPNATAPPAPGDWTVKSSFDGARFSGAANASLSGWAWSPNAAGGGIAPLNVSFVVDGRALGSVLAVLPRPNLPKTGAPNVEHGYDFAVGGALSGAAKHEVQVIVATPSGGVQSADSPMCFMAAARVACSSPH